MPTYNVDARGTVRKDGTAPRYIDPVREEFRPQWMVARCEDVFRDTAETFYIGPFATRAEALAYIDDAGLIGTPGYVEIVPLRDSYPY